MNNWNSISYVQRQINYILKNVRWFFKAFINDIVTRFRSFKNHLTHFKKSSIFFKFNIFIKSTKMFFNYFNVVLLKQRINVLNLSITSEKLKIIISFKFFKTFKNLKDYFDFTKYIRNHIYYYFAIIKIWENLKITLLKASSKSNHKRKHYINKIKILFTQKKSFIRDFSRNT